MQSSSSSPAPAYRLDELGWLQFERLCSLVLAADAGLTEVGWLGHADTGRVALVEEPIVLAGRSTQLAGPVTLAVVWIREGDSSTQRLSELVERISALPIELGFLCDQRVLVLTNLDGAAAQEELARQPCMEHRNVLVLGHHELSGSLDRDAGLRAAMPSVLGLRDLAPLIPATVRSTSSVDVERDQALARVFWPTRAYQRARDVLARHRFVVLTGPPEMGKTAIAQMLALAQLTAGWEAHECGSPEQLWRVFDRSRRQVFVADDAFGSTEYRPDAAERWARALGRLLAMLDDDHWLIWTSRPAPLKAGLRRVQSERGLARFPAPGEVLIDASELDLAEKTLILFRHAKARGATGKARTLVRSAALSIVEHPHFTPERIRRFVTDRIETLPQLAIEGSDRQVRDAIERELASPTEAMRTSFRALEAEHREFLIALLDAPEGLIDERDLAATVRRHHSGGLSRPPGELIDRLTDHFLRITPLGIGWVHPSWRDLVIDELREDTATRRRFLGACHAHGAMLALSGEGGVAGERLLPLLVSDHDWDVLGDRLRALLYELEDADLARLLLALRTVLTAGIHRVQRREAHGLAEYLLRTTARRWDERHQPLPVFLIDAWYALNESALAPARPPNLGPSWAELYPVPRPFDGLERSELARADEWLSLAQTLARFDRPALRALGFYSRETWDLIERVIESIERTPDPGIRPLIDDVLARIEGLTPDYMHVVVSSIRPESADERRWWAPEDIAAPPSTEPVRSGLVDFTREDVDRALSDL